MKKYVKLTSIIASILIISNVVNIFGADKSNSKLNEQNIEVKFRQAIDIPDEFLNDKNSMQEMIQVGKLTDWQYNVSEQRFERFVSYDNLEISVNDNIVDDDNGKVRVLSNSNDDVKVSVYDPILDKTYNQIIDGNSDDNVVTFDLDISSMFSLDQDNKTLNKENNLQKASSTDPYWSDGELGFYGDRLHCNRFNGWQGDGRYYSNELSPKAVINFFQSDCDIALGSYTKCLADYTSNPFCAASPQSKQGSCSTLIGHYNRFHKHTSFSS